MTTSDPLAMRYDPSLCGVPMTDPKAPKPLSNPTHYDFTIKPIDAIEAWGLNFSRGCVVKYVARAEHKGTELEDLVKARDYLDREIARVRARA